MCDICKELVACPVGEKRKVYFQEPMNPHFTDYYGRTFTIEGPYFVIDKYPNKTNCFIVEHMFDEIYVNYGFWLRDVKFCPFCGEKLVND